METRAQQVKDHEFTVKVKADSVLGAYGLACDVVYDPQFLEVVDIDASPAKVQPKVDEGVVFNQNGAATTFLRSALQDATPGTLVLGLTRSGDAAGVDADGATLVTIHFLARKIGATNIQFARPGLLASDLTPITAGSWSGASVEILKAFQGDINNDTNVDLMDAITALRVLAGQKPSPLNMDADTNLDGVIGFPEAHFVLQKVAGAR
jgi:hypothetical protein